MTKYTMELGKQFESVLEQLATSKEVTKAEIIRRAVATYYYLYKETSTDNKKVSITDQNEKVLKDVVLP